MSNEALTWAFRQDAGTTGAKFVLIALADQANTRHEADPSQKKIAAMTGQGVRTVQRHLADLEVRGLISRTHRNEGLSVRHSDLYTLPIQVVVGTGAKLTRATLTHVNIDAEAAINTGQNGGIKEPKELNPLEPLSSAVPPTRPEVESLCSLLADEIERNGSKRPLITKGWRDACRLMIDRDGREPDKIERAILWCQQDEFWRVNILSMPKLRQQYDRLRLAASRSTAPRDLDAERATARVQSRRGPLGWAKSG